ncbi:hypothetical protein ACO0K9_26755 [Undibacterium sp. Ji50W]|uniref:hypothetical protein n=1 Tax=Undibacterium sp. Ji50W TaxID=3413041 RepID=UPI003BF35197
MRATLAFLSLLIVNLGQTLPAHAQLAPWSRDKATVDALRSDVETRWLKNFPGGRPRAHLGSRDMASFALDATAVGYDPQRIFAVLRVLQGMQDNNPASKTYGNIHWDYGDTTISDLNGVEFVTRHLSLLWLIFRDRLDAQARATLRDMLRLSVEGIYRHKVPITYTNIWLKKSWNLIALGEGMDQPELSSGGQVMLRQWLDATRAAGITEYSSPTYYETDLENLALTANASRDAENRRLAHEGLEIMWNDIAMNWYAPAERMGGVHSRDYDRLFNAPGSLMKRAGWTNNGGGSIQIGPYSYYSWVPPSDNASAWLQAPLPRTVIERHGDAMERRTTQYLARHFSIGSAESGYHNMDTAPLAVNLGSDREAPVITYIMDGRRDYYGVSKIVDTSGHDKSLHLRPFISSVQRKAEVLLVAAGEEDKQGNLALESTFILPADAEYWLDDTKLVFFHHRSSWQSDPVPNGQTTQLEVTGETAKVRLHLVDQDQAQGLGVSRMFAVQGGQRYRFSVSFSGGSISLYMNFYGPDGRLLGGEHSKRVQGSDSQPQTFEVQAPPNAEKMKTWLYSTIRDTTDIIVSDLRVDALNAAGPATSLANFDFQPYRAERVTVPTGSTLFIRRKDSVLALRPVGVWDIAGRNINFELVNDGLNSGALRMTATHASGSSSGRGASAIFASVSEDLSDNAVFARFRTSILQRHGVAKWEGSKITARVDNDIAPMFIEADLVSGKRLQRSGMEEVVDNAVLNVNGRVLSLGSGPSH